MSTFFTFFALTILIAKINTKTRKTSKIVRNVVGGAKKIGASCDACYENKSISKGSIFFLFFFGSKKCHDPSYPHAVIYFSSTICYCDLLLFLHIQYTPPQGNSFGLFFWEPWRISLGRGVKFVPFYPR